MTLGASLSLTGSLVHEGKLTQEGYDVCVKVVNDKGGVKAGGKTYKLAISYQDDTSKADTAGQLVDQFNDKGVKLILGPYGSATTESTAAVTRPRSSSTRATPRAVPASASVVAAASLSACSSSFFGSLTSP